MPLLPQMLPDRELTGVWRRTLIFICLASADGRVGNFHCPRSHQDCSLCTGRRAKGFYMDRLIYFSHHCIS